MGYNKQLNDSYRIVYTDTGSTALPDIHTFDHTGVYSLIAKPSQLGKTVPIGFSVLSGGKVTNTTLAEGNYFVECSELESNIYWNFSFLGKANSGSDFTAQNTMVTYDKSKGTYTVKTDELSGGGGGVLTPVTVRIEPNSTSSGTAVNCTCYETSDGILFGSGDFALPTNSAAGGYYTLSGTYKYPTGFDMLAIIPMAKSFAAGLNEKEIAYWAKAQTTWFAIYCTYYKSSTSTATITASPKVSFILKRA